MFTQKNPQFTHHHWILSTPWPTVNRTLFRAALCFLFSEESSSISTTSSTREGGWTLETFKQMACTLQLMDPSIFASWFCAFKCKRLSLRNVVHLETTSRGGRRSDGMLTEEILLKTLVSLQLWISWKNPLLR